MPKDPNEPWAEFAKVLTSEMAKSKTSTHALTKRLSARYPELTEQTVANWRRARSRPGLDMLGPIVDAINEERRTPPGDEPLSLLMLLRKMHVLPETSEDPSVYDQAYRLVKLQLKQQDAQDALARLARQSGAASVVQAALGDADWAVAVQPIYEGPSETYQLHIADRIDLKWLASDRSDPDDAVWANPWIKPALRQTYAMPSNQIPRWSEPNKRATTHDDVSRWAISHITSPREPIVSVRWPNIRAVALVSTTRKSLVNEVASFVAIGLGYGLVSTPYLAMTATGDRPSVTGVFKQYDAHEYLLGDPPHRRVWSHWGMPAGYGELPFGTYDTIDDRTPRFIYLDEPDEMLKQTVDSFVKFDELVASRETLRKAAAAFPATHLLQLSTRREEDAHARWEQVFDQAAQVLEWLSDPEISVLAPRILRKAHRRAEEADPRVAKPFLTWLREVRNWPPPATTDGEAATDPD